MKTLDDYNIKKTSQRIKIYNYIILHSSFEMNDLINEFSDIFPSTIYRTVNLFLEKEIIDKRMVDGKISYSYHLQHHHTLECSLCHQKILIDNCPYVMTNYNGFKILEEENIKGICAECQKKNMKYGVFVGSFNPPTNAHFDIGKILIDKHLVDKVIYIPSSNLQKKKLLIPLKVRYDMLYSYIRKHNEFLISDIKLKDHNENFTFNDLEKLNIKKDNLYIIIGSDNFEQMDLWDNYSIMMKKYKFIIIKRHGCNIDEVIKNKFNKYKDNFIIIDYHNNISSSLVRDNILCNNEFNSLVPPSVYEYINKHNLYR